MRARYRLMVLLSCAVACGRPATTTTADELTAAIAAYERQTPDASEDRVTALFAKLDAEIATARADELSHPPAEREPFRQRREGLERTRYDLQARYLKARVARLGNDASDALKQLGGEVGRGLEDAGRKLRESMEHPAPPPN